MDQLELADFEPADEELPPFETTASTFPFEDCEPCLRGSCGFRLDAEVVATYFLPGVVFFFSCLEVLGEAFGARASKPPVVAVLFGDGSSTALSGPFVGSLPSSADSWGDINLAVGFGPEADGPLDFFSIGCAGGGLDEEDERGFKGGSVC